MLRHGSSPNECDECADAQPQWQEMHWCNIDNLAVHTGHLYTRSQLKFHMFSDCIYPFSGMDCRLLSAMNDADAQPQCREMRSRNATNFAMSIGHLYTSFAQFRISNMFLSVYIDPPARIIAQ